MGCTDQALACVRVLVLVKTASARQLCARPQAAADFAAVRITAGPAPSAMPAAGKIEVEFANGSRVRITGPVDPALVRAMIATLVKAKRHR